MALLMMDDIVLDVVMHPQPQPQAGNGADAALIVASAPQPAPPDAPDHPA